MSVCSQFGISHSSFLTWEPEDRAKALAFEIAKNERCTLCGTAPWEWEEDKFAYEAADHFCQGCYKKNVASEGQGRLPGTTVELIRVTPQVRAQQQLLAERRRSRQKQED